MLLLGNTSRTFFIFFIYSRSGVIGSTRPGCRSSVSCDWLCLPCDPEQDHITLKLPAWTEWLTDCSSSHLWLDLSRSYLTPVRDEEAEAQRKARSRHARQSRRSTQVKNKKNHHLPTMKPAQLCTSTDCKPHTSSWCEGSHADRPARGREDDKNHEDRKQGKRERGGGGEREGLQSEERERRGGGESYI